MSDTPRNDLIRMAGAFGDIQEVRFVDRNDHDDDDVIGRLVGFPIVYGKWTEISGWEGNFMEQIAPGAPDRHLKTHRDKVKVLFNHGMDPTIGDKPLGKPDVIESKKRGLWTETPLLDTSYNQDLHVLLSAEAIDGMSFRFNVQREEWKDEPKPTKQNPKGLPQRTIRELKLFEFGPVTFPAYEATTAGIRGRPAYLEHIKQVSTPDGTLTLANDGVSISGNTITIDALAHSHPSATGKDVARLSRAVTRSLKEHDNGRTTRQTR